MQDLIGRVVGHYRIVEHLGGGGMGVVYKAEDTKLGRMVALKFLPPEWSRDPDARERFLREARAASALEDSRICTIHDIDETDDGQLFIAMAYYEGESLKKRLEQGRLPIDEAVDIAIQVAEGLERAHAADIVHRDIKPANLMLTGRDEVVIVDFGLAKLAGEHSLTQAGVTIGTPQYMSPEQARGREVRLITDVWSLGAVLFEMVAGERPFGGESGDAVVHSILYEKPPRLRDLRADTPPMLERVVKRTLEKDPKRRYESVEDLLTDLRAVKAIRSETDLETSAIDTPSGRRRHLIARLGLVFLMVFVIAMTWVLSQQSRALPEPDQPPRIVVLPFENLGPPGDEYFADGMTEEIISRLTVVGGLQVISRTSAMQYKDSDKVIRQIGDELNVQYALEGTVRWERADEGFGRVRITPQLIHVADDAHVWSDRYDRAIESVFEVQSEIAEHVVGQLHVNLLKPERDALALKPTDIPGAYEAYLRGRHHYSITDSDQINLAITMYERAVALDPDFAMAWAYLSMRHGYLYFSGMDRTPDRAAAARRAADRALEADPNLPLAYRALGMYYYRVERDNEQALDLFNQALAIRSDDPGTLGSKGLVLRRMGRWQESVALHEELFVASPRDTNLAFMLTTSHGFLRNYDHALGLADLTISLAPDRWDGYSNKVHVLTKQGRLTAARSVLENSPVRAAEWGIRQVELDICERRYLAALSRIRELSPAVYERALGDPGAGQRALDQCVCHYFLGNQAGVRELCGLARTRFEEMTRKSPEQPGLRASLGLSYAYLGRKEEAIREGRMAVELLSVSEDSLAGPSLVQNLAQIHALLGEPDAALDKIEYVLSIPSRFSVGLLRVQPVWDPLRDHPRFQALLEEYGEDGKQVPEAGLDPLANTGRGSLSRKILYKSTVYSNKQLSLCYLVEN